MRFISFLFTTFLVLLTACAQPKTQLPEATASEIRAEKERFEQYLYDKDFSQIYEKTPTKSAMETRIARVAKRVGPAAIELCKELRQNDKAGKKRRCLFDVELGPYDDDSFNAFADGNKVVIGRKLMELFQNDEQLAFVIAHEFAHNIMGHIEDTKTNVTGGLILGAILDAASAGAGVRTGGGFAKMGAQMAQLSYSPAYEHEADYVGLYILSRAGYDISQAAEVWRLMAAVNPDSIYTATTHPTSPERFVMMGKVVEEIERKQREKADMLPEMKKVSSEESALSQ